MKTNEEAIKKIPLRQQQVIWCLQNGWQIICSSESTGAWICTPSYQFHINNGVFFRMVNDDLIYQTSDTYDWVLTERGLNVKTKEFVPTIEMSTK